MNDSPPLEVQLAVAKTGKYATRESGDTVEVVERPRGGMSVVVVDGQRSGRSAKAISNLAVQKAISLLSEGVRDGAVARATHDYLEVQRGGQVSAELTIISVDLATSTLVISRNARCPALLRVGGELRWLDSPSEAVGVHAGTKPAISEFALERDTTLLVFTDGVWAAGCRSGEKIDLPGLLERTLPGGGERDAGSAALLANTVLAEALRLDQNRPHDDATVVVLLIAPQVQPSLVRRLAMSFPLQEG